MNTGIDNTQLRLITEIIRDTLPDAAVYLYGSRATGKMWRYSDIDLALACGTEKISPVKLAGLASAFEESPLPCKVDIIDLNNITAEFKSAIAADLRRLW